ncbi:uncharacterized protein BJ212DRAFT_732170 [Suillus subaureus]|uniref:Uncharacterized protein n=1 Tax=Suillus subaureus TaxID=48587 RepID=A0A9P7E0W7_9AGAM|nr:uncharacterized protein BJ212DRAFT_732170 [Suillus subaureus]KAG1807868.1 hypothetical protein BJ212DRAFT_732170 [Suillus subaureus]
MSNSLEPPPPLTEKLTVKEVLISIGVGIFFLFNVINSICIVVIFIYLGSTIPVLKPYATYVAVYTLGARTVFFACMFLVGCYWCCLRLVAPKQAGSSISEWYSKVQVHSSKASVPSYRKLGKAGRTFFATTGVLYAFNGLHYCFRPERVPEFGVYKPVIGEGCQ